MEGCPRWRGSTDESSGEARPLKKRVTLACWDYDRTVALATGQVAPTGIDLCYLPLLPAETFYRMLRHEEFDAAEMSLSSYLITLGRDAPFVAIPVFPSRAFRHSAVYVSGRSRVERPQDLVGATVGLPEYQVTAAVWIRGILDEFYGVPTMSVHYRTGGLEQPGRIEKLPIAPEGIDVEPIGQSETLAGMLAAGALDAVYSPRILRGFDGVTIRRLWPDVRAVEREYFRSNGIFPIMHTVVIRRAVYERDPWIARSLFDAFCAAKAHVMGRLRDNGVLAVSLPWAYEDARDAAELMGDDYWAYGVEENRKVLETFARYSFEQGLAERLYSPEELFAAETQEQFRI